MEQANRGRPLSVGHPNHLLGARSTSASARSASSFNDGDTAAFTNNYNSQLNTGAFDPSFSQDPSQSSQYTLTGDYSNFAAQTQSQQQPQLNGFGSHDYLSAQTYSNSDLNSANFDPNAVAAFPTFDIDQAELDAALNDTLLTDVDGVANSDILSSQSSPIYSNGTSPGVFDPNMAATLAQQNAHTPPHLLHSDDVRRHSSTPSPHASPNFAQNGFLHNGGRSISDTLDPSSAYLPVQNEWASMNMGYRPQHRRMASDNVSDISSAHASPYMNSLDTFDPIAQTSPLLQSHADPAFENGLGLGGFSLNENQSQQSFHTPGHSPGHSPLLMPQPQQGLPQFTAENNFGLNTGMNGQYNNTNLDIYTGAEPFPALLNQAPSPGGMSDAMSPPAINIETVPYQNNNPPPTLKTENSQDALDVPTRTSRQRAKSDSHADARRTPVSRGRSPSLQPHNIPLPESRGLSESRSASSRASSPGLFRGRAGSVNHNRARSHSHTSDQRDYILDLADPSRSHSASGHSAEGASPNGSAAGTGSKRAQKHPATFQCSLCPKRFTRAYNLRSHLRTHTDERPFVCTVCGKAFARQHDRKRHEGLHSGEKKFVCRGALASGGAWGCGRRFARADALGRHFRSEAGRVCIKALLDEERDERQRQMFSEQAAFAQQQQQQQQQQANLLTVGGGGGAVQQPELFFPQALLAQYPALANIDWSGMPPAGGGAGSGMEYDASSGGEYMDDLSEGEIPYEYDAGQSNGRYPGNGNALMGGGHQQSAYPPTYGGGLQQTGDLLSDFEGR